MDRQFIIDKLEQLETVFQKIKKIHHSTSEDEVQVDDYEFNYEFNLFCTSF